MSETIEIIDRGRGPQLSTSRITVQDLVPYILRQCSHEQIITVMPVLTVAEIEVVERYVRDHHQEVMDQDRHIRQRSANRKNPPHVEEILRHGGERMAALREQFQRRDGSEERNGDNACR